MTASIRRTVMIATRPCTDSVGTHLCSLLAVGPERAGEEHQTILEEVQVDRVRHLQTRGPALDLHGRHTLASKHVQLSHVSDNLSDMPVSVRVSIYIYIYGGSVRLVCVFVCWTVRLLKPSMS